MDETLDVTAVAAALGVKRSAIRKAIARGTLAARRVESGTGYKYVIDATEVDRYAREHRVTRLADRP